MYVATGLICLGESEDVNPVVCHRSTGGTQAPQWISAVQVTRRWENTLKLFTKRGRPLIRARNAVSMLLTIYRSGGMRGPPVFGVVMLQ